MTVRKKKSETDVLVDMGALGILHLEVKMKDNHDSTKVTGQIEDFQQKCNTLKALHPNKKINSIIYFVEKGQKYKKKYKANGINVKYGKELFTDILGKTEEDYEHFMEENQIDFQIRDINLDKNYKENAQTIYNEMGYKQLDEAIKKIPSEIMKIISPDGSFYDELCEIMGRIY